MAVSSTFLLAVGEVAEKASFRALDWVALLCYLMVIVGIGVYFAKKEKTTEDYFLAGRRIPWWAATLSIFSTHLSAITFMGIPASAYHGDWSSILVNVGIILVAPVTVFCFIPFYRRLNVTTVYEYLEKRFSPAMRVYGSVAFVVLQLVKMGVFLVLPAIALSTVTHFDLHTCVVIMGVLCTVYTVMGGIAAVVWTDVLQSFVLIGGGLLCMGLIFGAEEFAIGEMFQRAVDADKFHVFNFDGGLDSNAFWVILIGGFFIQMVPFTSDQSLTQRFLTTPTEKGAARSIWAHAVMVVPASLLFFGLGTALYIYYATRTGAAPPAELRKDVVVPWFVMHQLPAGLAGLVIAGLFAATMSTVDSGMHSVATSLVNDIYRKLKPGAEDGDYLKVAKILTVVVGMLGTGSALLISGFEAGSLWIFFLICVGLFGSSLAGVFILGVFTKRANASGTAVGVLASVVILITLRSLDASPIHGILTAAVGALSCVAVGYLASMIFGRSEKSLENLTVHTLRITDEQP